MPAYAPPAGSTPGAQLPSLGGAPGSLSEQFRNYIPEAGFWSYLQNLGLTGTDPAGMFAQRRLPSYYGRYQAAAADNPNLGFFEYLNTQAPDPRQEFAAQSPEQRFDFSSRNLTPRARWSVAG